MLKFSHYLMQFNSSKLVVLMSTPGPHHMCECAKNTYILGRELSIILNVFHPSNLIGFCHADNQRVNIISGTMNSTLKLLDGKW